jgi:hypothetical protein
MFSRDIARAVSRRVEVLRCPSRYGMKMPGRRKTSARCRSIRISILEADLAGA